jgi:hypothetical protein
VRELENQARLADTGLTADENAGAAAAGGAAPRLEQLSHLRVPPDERQGRRVRNDRGCRGRFERRFWLKVLAARNRFAQRDRFGHRLDLQLQSKQLRKAFVFGQRAGAVAGFAAQRHDLAHDVFTPWIDREDLLGPGNSVDEITLPAGLRDEL